MSDIPTKTYPPSFLHALIADHEAERAGARSEESSAVQPVFVMRDARPTRSSVTSHRRHASGASVSCLTRHGRIKQR